MGYLKVWGQIYYYIIYKLAGSLMKMDNTREILKNAFTVIVTIGDV